ncbi:Rpn family recombination-promoting nuclease/putative transposase [Candidatus Enterococcus murrayae]|uniref:Rpn family recombination-promoting nuclease/putative transposase n=1 Tax=Candidatus Enterococcus murrayae TaxID=2815321 RepID=A0ABS3HMH4_9ENTE|nr:Rpn family recombination-promoting nuclease/putative transposase [Enterococcus sp. MJM16]MBO0454654.1 Rpn family recombination-promoting nuclease/putative transposase [Enterococcus sp. MJM16]
MQKFLPTNDLLFKKMLTSEDSLHILKAFVKDFIGIEFKSLRPKETYHIDSYKKSYKKMEIIRTEVDILAISEDGSQATIECQIQPHKYFHERSLFYLCEAYRSPFGNVKTKEVEKKNNFSSLRPAYGINIVDFHIFDWNEDALQLFHLFNKKTCQPFLNKEGKELLVLGFLSLKNENIDRKTAVYHWQYFLKTGEVIADSPEYIKEAKRKTDFLTLESEEKEMIMNIEKSKAISDAVFVTAIEEAKEAGIKQGINQGIKQGLEQGREEERLAIIINLLKSGMTVEQVSKATGSDVGLVKKISEERE